MGSVALQPRFSHRDDGVYSSVRSTIAGSELGDGATAQVHELIIAAADAYQDAAKLMSTSSSVEYHGRFLRTLVAKDRALKQRQAERERKARELDHQHMQRNGNGVQQPAGHDLSPTSATSRSRLTPPPTMAVPSYTRTNMNGSVHTRPAVVTSGLHQPRPTHPSATSGGAYPSGAWHFPASPRLPAHPLVSPEDEVSLELQAAGMQANYAHLGADQIREGGDGYTQKMEVAYWYNMYSDLGYGGGVNPTPATVMNVQQQPYSVRPLDPQIQQPYGPNGTVSAG